MRPGEAWEEHGLSQFLERRGSHTEPDLNYVAHCRPDFCNPQGETGAQRRSGTCLRSHSLAVTKQDVEAGLLPLAHAHTPGEGEEQGPGLHPSPPPAFGFPDLESIYLEDSLLSGPSQDDSLLAFSSPGLSPDGWPSLEEPPIMAAAPQPPSPEQQQRLAGPEGGACPQGSLPSVGSGSLWEDEVFYN